MSPWSPLLLWCSTLWYRIREIPQFSRLNAGDRQTHSQTWTCALGIDAIVVSKAADSFLSLFWRGANSENLVTNPHRSYSNFHSTWSVAVFFLRSVFKIPLEWSAQRAELATLHVQRELGSFAFGFLFSSVLLSIKLHEHVLILAVVS